MAILISHRGNTTGPFPNLENHPEYIMNALKKGYDVEIDIWNTVDGWFLGHDEPKYRIDYWEFTQSVNNDKIWYHAKNMKALEKLTYDFRPLQYFWHEDDRFTLTSKNVIWSFPGEPLSEKSVCVLPEIFGLTKEDTFWYCHGICSDYIEQYK